MPVVVPAATPNIDSLVVRLPGLPDFNAGDPSFRINDFGGWYETAVPDVILVANGGGAGAVAVGEWVDQEAYYSLDGMLSGADRGSVEGLRRMLLAALPPTAENPVQVLQGADGLQVFVRRYDKPTLTPIGPRLMQFSLPLVAPDPYKYALEPLSGTVGVFSGVDWYRTYDVSGARPFRTYTARSRTYAQSGTAGRYPLSLGLFSPGDASSRRVTVDVVGPQASGWWLERDDAYGVVVERIYTDLALSAGQTLTYDSVARSARVNGADVSYLTFGDFLTLPPGDSTFRLVASDDLGGYATFSALPAYL